MTLIHTNRHLPQAVTTKGAIQYGMNNQIKSTLSTDRVALLRQLDEIIADIWEHYCGGDASMLREPFLKEARSLIIDKFGMLGINELREAFRLASVNIYDVNLSSYGGKVRLQTIGECLSKYIEYRRPIVSQLLREQQVIEAQANIEQDRIKKEQYQASVVHWFLNAKQATRDECRFYKLDTLEELGHISFTQEQIAQFVALAKKELEQEARNDKSDAKTIQGMRDAHKSLTAIIEGSAKERIIKRAKEIALHTIINDRNRS
jgi:hypothetical protein